MKESTINAAIVLVAIIVVVLFILQLNKQSKKSIKKINDMRRDFEEKRKEIELRHEHHAI